MSRFAAAALAAFAVVGCSSSTGPTNVNGMWDYVATHIVEGAATCSAEVVMTLTQSGDTFTGSYAGASFACSGRGELLPPGYVVSGRIHGDSVSFILSGAALTDSSVGTIAGGSMTGTLTITDSSQAGLFHYFGQWTATKQ